MTRGSGRLAVWGTLTAACVLFAWQVVAHTQSTIGRETAVSRHLRDGEDGTLPVRDLVEFGRQLFTASWTDQDGAGRPLNKGTGQPLSDPARPLTGARAFNRVSGPDANSCQGCHNAPFGITGGNGDIVTSAFESAQRFDFVSFDRTDTKATSGAVDESRRAVSLQTIGAVRSTPGLFGAGYLEMLARQITADLQRVRDSLAPGQSRPLVAKGISFGTLARRSDGQWDVSRVDGLPASSVRVAGGKPSLVVCPWRRDGSGASLREVTIEEYNRHHGIQAADRFGVDTDPDGDGVPNEITHADLTAAVVFEATLPVPGRLISTAPEIEQAVWMGEQLFERIGCARCHVRSLPLDRRGWIYSQPGIDEDGTLRRAEPRAVAVDLTSAALPQPRLVPAHATAAAVQIPAYTDFKLHDITDPGQPSDDERKFLTRRLWGVGNQPPYFHHGRFTTLREAVRAHAGEALEERAAFDRLRKHEQDCLVEFLKSLQVLPPGTKDLIVDQDHRARSWPPPRIRRGQISNF
jgi:hypothetical protein